MTPIMFVSVANAIIVGVLIFNLMRKNKDIRELQSALDHWKKCAAHHEDEARSFRGRRDAIYESLQDATKDVKQMREAHDACAKKLHETEAQFAAFKAGSENIKTSYDACASELKQIKAIADFREATIRELRADLDKSESALASVGQIRNLLHQLLITAVPMDRGRTSQSNDVQTTSSGPITRSKAEKYLADKDAGRLHPHDRKYPFTICMECEDAVREKLAIRRNLGREKYGHSMERDDLSREDWLLHAQEEAMDLCVYLERCIRDQRSRVGGEYSNKENTTNQSLVSMLRATTGV